MKHQLCFCMLLSFAVCHISFAQLHVKAEKKVGGSDNDNFTCMVKTPDGGVLMGGYSSSNTSRQKSEDCRGATDYWIVKLDNTGKYEWDKTIGGSSFDKLSAISLTSDGGYILCGDSNSPASGEKTEDSYGFTDYWIVKLDANRNVQWDKTIGGEYIDDATSLITTTDGGYLAGGWSTSAPSGNKTAAFFGSNDYWIVKLDNAGNIQWDKSYGGSESDLLTNLMQASDGGYVLAGYSYSSVSGNKTQINRGADDYWVVKTNASGIIQWNTTVGGDSYDEVADIVEGQNGSIIVGGSSKSNASGDKTQDNHDINQNSNDYWVVKLNSKGKMMYDRTIGGPGEDKLTGLYKNTHGTVLYGSSNSWAGDKTDPAPGTWVVALDNSQQIRWDVTLLIYEAVSAVAISNNRFALGGNYRVNQTYDFQITDVRYNNTDNELTSPSEANINAANSKRSSFTFIIYPNPASQVVHIQSTGKAKFELSDQHGKVLLTRIIEGNEDIPLYNIPSGMYFLRNTTTNATQKLIIAK
ncbi:T9SS type A sorting domain-containing protein [Ilyomonas limi]|uniref:T9SS type A sorting domain-containing protein n=1 Tax=Ilyomonas limi TaxID=2575867 RepID=A0A4U3L2L6_9BACT|nr:T9SS type A sorting domain-containing protein [Ilyomonas limi]TKK68489.1 T9SS type A sorting domain-containing protein [Ilyomonas limi]